MFKISPLKPEGRQLALNTISSNTFFMLVADALSNKQPLSVVRMGDGEHHFMTDNGPLEDPVKPYPNFDEKWLRKLGVEGISRGALRERLYHAAINCTYFAPSVSGIQREEFNLYQFFPPRDRYVDNFFINAWDDNLRIPLFKAAKHVLFVHNNPNTANALQIRARAGLGVKVDWIPLSNWQQTEDVAQQANQNDAPLVLLCTGPAGKYLGPNIAVQGSIPKVCIDLGNGADHWTFEKKFGHLRAADAAAVEVA